MPSLTALLENREQTGPQAGWRSCASNSMTRASSCRRRNGPGSLYRTQDDPT